MSLGENIKRIRALKEMTIKDIADKTELTRSLISQIENNKANPSLKSLYAIAEALGVPIITLFQETAEEASPVVRFAERKVVTTPVPGIDYHLLLPAKKRPDVEFLLIVYHKGGSTMVKKNHAGVEFGVVVKGELTVEYDDALHVLRPGDSIYIECDKPHILTNSFDGDTEAIWVEVLRTR